MTTTNVTSEVIGSVWKVEMKVGDRVESGDVIMILESMKMEIPIEAEAGGRVVEIQGPEGTVLDEDAVVMTLEG